MSPLSAAFWVGLLKIVWINIILSGDNAVVIALACRGIPAHQRRLGIAIGTVVAIVLLIVFAIFIAELFAVPYLKLVGGVLLIWIAAQLIAPGDDGNAEDKVRAAPTLFGAIRTIVIADVVMSLDNVIGIAAAANGNHVLIALGLLISVPIIIYGSTLLMMVMNRFPVFSLLGAGLIAWVGGEIIVSDPSVQGWIAAAMPVHEADYVAPPVGVLLAFMGGKLLTFRAKASGQGGSSATNRD